MEACRGLGWNAIRSGLEGGCFGRTRRQENCFQASMEPAKIRLRRERYKASNVRECWLIRIVPKEMSDYDKTLVH